MSKLIQVWELNSEEQDNLWIKNQCPFCKSNIIDRDLTVDIAYWNCRYCDVQFIVQ